MRLHMKKCIHHSHAMAHTHNHITYIQSDKIGLKFVFNPVVFILMQGFENIPASCSIIYMLYYQTRQLFHNITDITHLFTPKGE